MEELDSGEFYNGTLRGFGDQLDRELVKGPFKMIERLLPHGDEAIDEGKFLTGVRLKLLERRFDIFL
jgi:hypothetical protein